jgi:hypothetical protein
MNIPALGKLKPDSHILEWLVSEPLEIPLLDGLRLSITLDSFVDGDQQDVENAISSFLKLGNADRLAVTPYVFANYKRMTELVSEEDLGCQITSEAAVWQHVHPNEIYVSRRPRRDRAIYISIAAECDWEPEHGLQIVYRRGSELVRVSDQDGHLTHTDALGLPEDLDQISS